MFRISLFLLSAGLCLAAQIVPAEAEIGAIRSRSAELASRLASLRGKIDASLVADVEVYLKAAEWALRFPEEFYKKEYVGYALAAAESGVRRAAELEQGRPSWPRALGPVVRAYCSRLDDSVQPYAVVVPKNHDFSAPARLDVVLHGRNATLTEASFIASFESPKAREALPAVLQLHVFGRTNNAYRWAGEQDVFEALESVRARYRVDPARIVLRGFSMGGAGAWHIGLHHPHLWAAVEAGAGFTETHRYAKQTSLPPYQDSTLRIYDAVESALNAYNLAVVGYGGEIDPQLQASVNIRERIAAEGLDLKELAALFLVGPQTPHRWHPDSKAESDRFIDGVLNRAPRTPRRIRFVTHTTRYPRTFRLRIDELERHYERAEIDATENGGALDIRTRNIRRLTLDEPARVTVDGHAFAESLRGLEKSGGSWRAARSSSSLRKTHGLQGPIDDAFNGPFLCVRPTGKPEHQGPAQLAGERLSRFLRDYAKWLRGDPPVKDDRNVTDTDIRERNLILFGDPSSNRVLARIASRLPLKWTKDTIQAGARRFAAADHLMVMVYPNPLNPSRYVVLNSGHTFGETEFRGTNALLFPRLGDWAVLGASGDTTAAGLFDDDWRLKE